MKRLVAALLVAMVLLPACEKPPPPPPKKTEAKPPPPPPTAQELRLSAIAKLADILSGVVPLGKEEVQNRVNAERSRLKGQLNGAAALRLLTADIRDALKGCRSNANWDGVLLLCNALEPLDPENVMLQRYREEAVVQKNKPIVELKGFTTHGDTGETMIFLNVTLPEENNRTESCKVEVGEEFHNLKLMRIVGKQKGVEIRYLPTNEDFEVMRQ